MREVRIALAAGLGLLAVGIVVVLAGSPTSVAHTNGTPEREARIATVTRGTSFCQVGELLPAGTSAIRLSWFAFSGPRVRVAVYAGGRTITSGEVGSGWTSREVTVPVRPLAHSVAGATVCGSFHMRNENVTVFGEPTPSGEAAYVGHKRLEGRMWIAYLRSGTRSWASLVPSILGHMELGRASSGPGIVFFALMSLAALVGLACYLVVKELS